MRSVSYQCDFHFHKILTCLLKSCGGDGGAQNKTKQTHQTGFPCNPSPWVATSLKPTQATGWDGLENQTGVRLYVWRMLTLLHDCLEWAWGLLWDFKRGSGKTLIMSELFKGKCPYFVRLPPFQFWWATTTTCCKYIMVAHIGISKETYSLKEKQDYYVAQVDLVFKFSGFNACVTGMYQCCIRALLTWGPNNVSYFPLPLWKSCSDFCSQPPILLGEMSF